MHDHQKDTQIQYPDVNVLFMLKLLTLYHPTQQICHISNFCIFFALNQQI